MLGGEKIPAVDHRRHQGAVIELRARARSPGRAGVALELFGGFVAEKLHAVAALDQCAAFGDEALQFDGADFRAVLFALAAHLGGFIIVEGAFGPLHGAMEQIDELLIRVKKSCE